MEATTRVEAVGTVDSRAVMVVEMMAMVELREATVVAMETRVAVMAALREVAVAATRVEVATRAPKVAATVALRQEDTAVPRVVATEEHRVVEVPLEDMVALRAEDMEVDTRTTALADQRKQDEVPVKEPPEEVLEVDTDRTRRHQYHPLTAGHSSSVI